MSALFCPLLIWFLNNWTTDNNVQNNASNRYELSVYVLQNAANYIRASLNFQHFPGEDTSGTPARKLPLVLVWIKTFTPAGLEC